MCTCNEGSHIRFNLAWQHIMHLWDRGIREYIKLYCRVWVAAHTVEHVFYNYTLCHSCSQLCTPLVIFKIVSHVRLLGVNLVSPCWNDGNVVTHPEVTLMSSCRMLNPTAEGVATVWLRECHLQQHSSHTECCFQLVDLASICI